VRNSRATGAIIVLVILSSKSSSASLVFLDEIGEYFDVVLDFSNLLFHVGRTLLLFAFHEFNLVLDHISFQHQFRGLFSNNLFGSPDSTLPFFTLFLSCSIDEVDSLWSYDFLPPVAREESTETFVLDAVL
jgi:hypothetical protein